ncbi:Fic family protein [Effusibacillus lacus]|uniref:Cell filamentation protein Fic n=1 Tax=Effusibacillus lacus TaxID=1348429 RepID=A0A292YKU7_9BACL|nr:Fic/DOC family N-terminal domain-containing protein [Effusibacillus lacus]TCS75128.1 Fic family protein [Effusibacillus lacus]GAX89080.1 cell filamentation protein Fic [Effusibacillus lacus]
MRRVPFEPMLLPLGEDVIDQLTFINELINANKSVAQYQIMLRNAKVSPKLLLNPIMLNEAVQSTKIEGTQVTLDEVLEVEAQSRKNNKDVQEVMNYFHALNQGMETLRMLPISTRLFKLLHKTLMSNAVRGSNRSPGEYRKSQNFIGPAGCTIETATYIPPEPQLVDKYMDNLEKYINNPKDNLNELVRIAIIHAQFETIHPFLDGNGRIGRILIPIYLYYKEVIDYPNFFLSETLEKDKHKYYRYLNDTRYKSDWNQWIKFFLESVDIQARKNIKLIEEFNNLYEHDLAIAQRLVNSSSIKTLVDAMFQRPVFTVKTMTIATGLSDATCRRYLATLEENRLIFSNNKQRSKTFYYYNLLDKLR